MLITRHGVLGGPRSIVRKINSARIHRVYPPPLQIKQEDEPTVIEIKSEEAEQVVEEIVSNVQFCVSEAEEKPEAEEVLVEEKKTKKKKNKKG